MNRIELPTTCKSSLSYGSIIIGDILAKDDKYTLIKLENNLVIRILNSDILKIEKKVSK